MDGRNVLEHNLEVGDCVKASFYTHWLTTDHQNPQDHVTRLQHSTSLSLQSDTIDGHCGTKDSRMIEFKWLFEQCVPLLSTQSKWISCFASSPPLPTHLYQVHFFRHLCAWTCMSIWSCVYNALLYMPRSVRPCLLTLWDDEVQKAGLCTSASSKQLMEVWGWSCISVTDAVLSSKGMLAEFAHF